MSNVSKKLLRKKKVMFVAHYVHAQCYLLLAFSLSCLLYWGSSHFFACENECGSACKTKKCPLLALRAIFFSGWCSNTHNLAFVFISVFGILWPFFTRSNTNLWSSPSDLWWGNFCVCSYRHNVSHFCANLMQIFQTCFLVVFISPSCFGLAQMFLAFSTYVHLTRSFYHS